MIPRQGCESGKSGSRFPATPLGLLGVTVIYNQKFPLIHSDQSSFGASVKLLPHPPVNLCSAPCVVWRSSGTHGSDFPSNRDVINENSRRMGGDSTHQTQPVQLERHRRENLAQHWLEGADPALNQTSCRIWAQSGSQGTPASPSALIPAKPRTTHQACHSLA